MNTLGIYIYNADRNEWYIGTEPKGAGRAVKWGRFSGAKEWPDGEERKVEELREAITGNDVTYTVALLQ